MMNCHSFSKAWLSLSANAADAGIALFDKKKWHERRLRFSPALCLHWSMTETARDAQIFRAGVGAFEEGE